MIVTIAAVGTGLAYLAYEYNIRNRIANIARKVVPYPKEDPRNIAVTQRRPIIMGAYSHGHGYSGCGDLWNYVLAQIHAPLSWINRDIPGYAKWKEAVNISKPYGAALKAGAWVEYKPGVNFPKKGDLVMIGRDNGEVTHVFVVLDSDGKSKLVTAEYGGGDNKSSLGHREIDSHGLTKGSTMVRHLSGWIDAEKIPTGQKWEKQT